MIDKGIKKIKTLMVVCLGFVVLGVNNISWDILVWKKVTPKKMPPDDTPVLVDVIHENGMREIIQEVVWYNPENTKGEIEHGWYFKDEWIFTPIDLWDDLKVVRWRYL